MQTLRNLKAWIQGPGLIWVFTILCIPSWGPYDKGIPLSHYFGSILGVPHRRPPFLYLVDDYGLGLRASSLSFQSILGMQMSPQEVYGPQSYRALNFYDSLTPSGLNFRSLKERRAARLPHHAAVNPADGPPRACRVSRAG